MGGACGTYGWEEGCIQGFVWEMEHLEDAGVDGSLSGRTPPYGFIYLFEFR